ncbi:MAG: NAD-dependent epimerase/dehydratase family protein [Elusimicrobiota bacterium]
MNVLVSGGAGFIGSHVSDALVKEGAGVTVVDNLSSGKRENINPACDFEKIDIRDRELESVFQKKDFKAVFHFAAQIDVRKSVADPAYDADVNIMGGINLLECSRRYGVESFIFASSGGVMYGECPHESPDESKYPSPECPYGCSKLSFEFYLNAYRKMHGIRAVSMRLANVYGPRQDPCGEAGVVAIFSRAMLRDEEVKIFGDGSQLRDYVYAGDVARACLKAHTKGNGVYNIGTGEARDVNELFNRIKKITGYKNDPEYLPSRPGELQASRMDAGKAFREIGWRAETDFETGLKKTLEYFKSSL